MPYSIMFSLSSNSNNLQAKLVDSSLIPEFAIALYENLPSGYILSQCNTIPRYVDLCDTFRDALDYNAREAHEDYHI